jgi:hypothetical protein
MSMKNSSDTIGNRTRDLPTCIPVPQLTATPRIPCTTDDRFQPQVSSNRNVIYKVALSSGVPRIFFLGGGGSTSSVEDRGQIERGSGDGSP